MTTIMFFLALSAWADNSPTVKPYTQGEARQAPSGSATVWRIAGAPEGAKQAFFGVLEIQPGAKVPVHRDTTEEYIFIIEGRGEMTIDGVTTAVLPGWAVFMPANAEVSFEVTGEIPVRAVQFFAGQGPESKYDRWVPANEPVKAGTTP